jgi:rRNA maturation protein Rpf1
MEGGSFARDLERWMKGALEVERLSLRELCEGNLERGASLLGTLEDV